MPGFEEAGAGWECSLIFFIPGVLIFLGTGSSIFWANWEITKWLAVMIIPTGWGIPSIIAMCFMIPLFVNQYKRKQRAKKHLQHLKESLAKNSV